MTHPAVGLFARQRRLAELAQDLGIPDARELWRWDGRLVAELLIVQSELRGD